MLTNIIQAQDLNDIWYKTLWQIWEKGRAYYIDSGSYAGEHRIGLDSVIIEIKYPREGNTAPTLPKDKEALIPITEEGIKVYFVNYILGTEIKDKETYTYGSRINTSLQEVINKYNKYGAGNNQCIIQVGQPDDIFCSDPPCLRHIDTKIIDGKLNFYIYFRSWEATSGLPTNLGGLGYLMDYMIENIDMDLKPGKFICHSKCLHIYSHMLDVIDIILGLPNSRKSIEQLKSELKGR